MRYLKGILILSILSSSYILANMSCPSDSSYHVDTREMLPDGSPNPTYGQEIATGLCGCLAFVDGAVLGLDETASAVGCISIILYKFGFDNGLPTYVLHQPWLRANT